MSQPLYLSTLLISLVFLAACNGTKSAPPASSLANNDSAKIAAGQASQVSPVPAFKGFGEHWNIDIQSTGQMQHRFKLVWGSGSGTIQGTLKYTDAVANAPASMIILSG